MVVLHTRAAPSLLSFARLPQRRSRCVAQATNKGSYDAVVVGGGISGLCTARVLAEDYSTRVPNVLVTEARSRVGGNIVTMSNEEGYLWEEGPNSFTPSDPLLKMAVMAGVEQELALGDPTAPRFVYWDQKLRKTPSGPDLLTFDLLSPWGKIRAGLGAIGIKSPPPGKEETIEEFIRRNLGAEVFERLIEPFCSGVYAGDPAKLSMEAAFGKIHALEKQGGSMIGGSLKLFNERRKNPLPPRDPTLPPKPAGQTVGSFRKGLKTLPEAISKQLSDKIRCDWKLLGISKGEDGMFEMSYETPDGEETIRSKTIALTVPSYIASTLLEGFSEEASKALSGFDYPPVGAVTVSYPLSAIRDDRLDEKGDLPGFGQLHPRSQVASLYLSIRMKRVFEQGIVTLGTIYSSSLFPGRAPSGHVLLLNYIGGATNRGILNQTDEELVDQVDQDLRKLLIKPDAVKPKAIGIRVWPKAIPQFNLGHLKALSTARRELDNAGCQNIRLGGNYVCGVALGKCVEYAFDFAEEISKSVESFEPVSKTVA